MAWLWVMLVLGAAADPPDAPPDAPTPAPLAEPLPAAPSEPVPEPAVPVSPPVPVPEPELDPSTAPFSDVLRGAKQIWFEGRSAEAREWFATLQGRILAGETPSPDEVAETLTYLGEIQYLDGDPEAARITFRALLQADRDVPISLYHHPTEVVNLFELVRTEVEAEATVPAPPPPRAPYWVLAPLGIPQFGQRRAGAGVVLGSLQVALATTSLVTYFQVRATNDRTLPHGVPEAEIPGMQLRRYAVQWPSTLAFYAVWFGGSVEAVQHLRRHHDEPKMTVVPLFRDGAVAGPPTGLALHSRF